MTDSMITRCPKCSTSFRVGADILSMAKGKVRCGQCFHIFEAKEVETIQRSAPPTTSAQHPIVKTREAAETETASSAPLFTSAAEEPPLNPEWLQTLFDDEDLNPIDKYDEKANLNRYSQSVIEKNADDLTDNDDSYSEQENLAAWEREYAELEPIDASRLNSPDVYSKPQKALVREKPPVSTSNNAFKEYQDQPSTLEATTPQSNSTNHAYVDEPEPDYMKALHSLAQSTANLNNTDQQTNLANRKLDAQTRLGALVTNHNEPSLKPKRSYTWAWFLSTFFALLILSYQAMQHYFYEGSQSATLRPLYKTLCTYTGCTLPSFEDISAIDIEHVRIQSHPTIANALLVNAIMTNTSNFSQNMPTIALEFFDLNGAPVAARLFEPNNFLHKDFLDITYMPPNTPIHLVIPIQDPGAQAVTHKIKVYSARTQSY